MHLKEETENKAEFPRVEFEQSTLPLKGASPVFFNFYVSASNQEAFSWVQRWPRWPYRCLALYGPAGCGKTHLGSVWAREINALRIPMEDCESKTPLEWVRESPRILSVLAPGSILAYPVKSFLFLLQLYNLIQEHKGSLLLLSCLPPARWEVPLSDLSSRLKSVMAIGISSPDVLLRKVMENCLQICNIACLQKLWSIC